MYTWKRARFACPSTYLLRHHLEFPCCHACVHVIVIDQIQIQLSVWKGLSGFHVLLWSGLLPPCRSNLLPWGTCTWRMDRDSFWCTPSLRSPPSMTFMTSGSRSWESRTEMMWGGGEGVQVVCVCVCVCARVCCSTYVVSTILIVVWLARSEMV